jgi:hypothetical protein
MSRGRSVTEAARGLGRGFERVYAAGVKRRNHREAPPTVDRTSLTPEDRFAGYAGTVTFVAADEASDGPGEPIAVHLTREHLMSLAEQIGALLASTGDEPDFFTGIRETLAKHREALKTSRRTFAEQSEERAEREVRQERIEQRVEDKK